MHKHSLLHTQKILFAFVHQERDKSMFSVTEDAFHAWLECIFKESSLKLEIVEMAYLELVVPKSMAATIKYLVILLALKHTKI